MGSENHPRDLLTVPAVLAYIAAVLVLVFMVGCFCLIFAGVKVEAVMLGLLGTLLAGITSLASLAYGYHLGASSGAKTASDALAQIAGAGPPPPAQPMAQETKP